jgi:hypothetical protein
MGDDRRLTLCNSAFGIHPIDYGRPSRGLLIGSGCGIMMAVMDACGGLRWAIDADDVRFRDLRGWVHALVRNELVQLVAVAGWFSISDPRPIARAVSGLNVPVLAYVGGGIALDSFKSVWATGELDRFVNTLRRYAGIALGVAPDLCDATAQGNAAPSGDDLGALPEAKKGGAGTSVPTPLRLVRN